MNVCSAAALVAVFVRWAMRWRVESAFLTALLLAIIAFYDPARLLGAADVGERFYLPAFAMAVLCMPAGGRVLAAAGLSQIFLPAYLAIMILTLPSVGANDPQLDHTAINAPGARYHLLYWHRPYLFYDEVAAAEAAKGGAMPSLPIAYQTSLLESVR